MKNDPPPNNFASAMPEFDKAMRALAHVPKAEIDRRLAREKRAKNPKPKPN